MNSERLTRIIVAPVVSEKATKAAERDQQFVFRLVKGATKNEIKAAVETLFKVTVEKVTVLNVKPEFRRTGRVIGKKSGWRKAYVTLAEGQDINLVGI